MVRLAGEAVKLERKGAGLLTYLALEGTTHRSVLAGLLWPETDEAAARSNLRQIIHRLRRAAGHTLLVGDDLLALSPQVQTDLAQLELAAFEGQHPLVLSLWGEVLGGFDFDDCPDFLEWLTARRERLLQMRLSALEALSEAAQRAGDLRAALRHAQERLELEPLSEVTHRRVIRLHYLLGDRAAALRAFGACEEVLRRELGVRPMPQTLALVQEIQSQQTLSADPPLSVGLPLAVQRPPQLVGRQAAWKALEAAWNAGQTVFLAGPGGIGKSRLAEDFLRSKGSYHLFEAQEGDSAIPYAALLRAYRRLLRTYPQLVLADWVRAELGRLLPELASGSAPLESAGEKLRFLEAQAFFVAQVLELGSARLLIENLHFQDQASVEVWAYVLRHPAVRDCGAFAVFTYRPEEISTETATRLQEALSAGQAARVEVQAWTAAEVGQVILDLALPVSAALAGALGRHTGGNPLFLLETLRSLIESGELEHADPERLPLPGRLERLVVRRLERLSGQASRLAGTLAVAGRDFSLELAAAVLEVGVLDLNAPWLELRAAQVLGEAGFTHDLLEHAVLAGLAAPIRQVLHGRVAQYLEHELEGKCVPGQGGEAARIAHHWQQAGEAGRAAPWWVQAGEGFLSQGAAAQASRAFTQAMQAQPAGALHRAALRGLGESLLGQDLAQAEEHLRALHREALDSQDARALMEASGLLAQLHLMRGELEAGLQASLEATGRLPAAPSGEERLLGAELWRGRYWLELRSGRLDRAQQAIQAALQLTPGRAALINELALLLWHAGRFEEAAAHYQDAKSTGAGEPVDPWLTGNQAWTLWALGRNEEAAKLLEGSLAQPGAPFDRGLKLSNLSVVLTSQGLYQRASEALQEARPLLRGYQLHMVDAHYRLGVVYYRAGRYGEAQACYGRALERARVVGDPYRLAYVLASHGANESLLGNLDSGRAHCNEALAITAGIQFPLASIIAEQAGALQAHLEGQPGAALEHALRALRLSQECGIPEQVGHSQLFVAQVAPARRQAALKDALALGERFGLPDLVWQAARELGMRTQAARALAFLRAHSPPGWFDRPAS